MRNSVLGKYVSWIALGILVLVGLTVSIYFSLQPRPIPKIKYSAFSQPQDISRAIVDRLRLEIKQSPLVFLGLNPENPEHYQVWQSFLDDLKKENIGFDVVVVDPHLPYKKMLTYIEEIDINLESERFYQGILTAQKKQKRIAVILPTVYSTYLIEQTPVSRLLRDHQIHGLSFSMSSFPTSATAELQFAYPCVPEQEDRLGTRNLGCMIIGKAKTTYRKKLPEGKRAGLVDQVGQNEYLVLFN